jgi:ATP-dependent DNA ligase
MDGVREGSACRFAVTGVDNDRTTSRRAARQAALRQLMFEPKLDSHRFAFHRVGGQVVLQSRQQRL